MLMLLRNLGQVVCGRPALFSYQATGSDDAVAGFPRRTYTLVVEVACRQIIAASGEAPFPNASRSHGPPKLFW